MLFDVLKKKSHVVWLVLLTLIYIGLQVPSIMIRDSEITIFNGVFCALQYAICLLMIRGNRKSGVVVSTTLMVGSLIFVSQAVIMGHNLSAVAGLFNTVLYLVTLLIIGKYQRNREFESITDILTGIQNRRGFYKELNIKIEEGKKFSVIYFSLDNFKNINDNYGHGFGDEILKRVANRMESVLQTNGSIARVSGAEFTIALDNKTDAEEMANRLLESVREELVVEVGRATVKCHLICYAGYATYPNDSKDYKTLIKYADVAMYEAMSMKSKKVCAFKSELLAKMEHQIDVEQLIKESLKKDYFYFVYQPQYKIDGKGLKGFEALVRMKTPEGLCISPGEFIPIAEKGELILDIDDYVLRHTMMEFKEIVEKKSDLKLSINVSAKNAGRKNFVDNVLSAINDTGFPISNLEIEITEYCMMESMEATVENITTLRDMGVEIALDDFGTGYTSLSYVAKLPIDLIKIDKSLVDDIEQSERSREFLHTIIAMGHLMECMVIAEGVETHKQLEDLKEDGCDFVQGFVWSKPLAYEDAKNLAFKC